ncbi:hypothetical protein BMS3Abin05_02083 [bacterium BMS3Abin05]|nr:hypothetical protein BMS3Abin05_02083 [bacterium BMS3Abin05]GBE28208.1 hypothetical protein BMS3Bbin03_02147 [bacterium BMS3Bbin03]HDL78279.1 hypothetical protein [Bacteroidota bacterium]HDZ12958.1 hypothetical protein [Bacteroidota bacterium]
MFHFVWYISGAILVGAYLFAFVFGSILVKFVVRNVSPVCMTKIKPIVWNVGTIIGLCETFIVITFILFDQFSALALVIAAKSLVRMKKMEEQPEYYLLGTFVNISFSILIGSLLKIFLFG